MRRDAWWTQPLVVFLGLTTFVVYSTWAACQGRHYYSGPVSFAFLFAGAVRGIIPQFVRAETRVVAGLAAVSPALLILWAPACFGSRVITIVALTTRPSGATRQPARWANRASVISGRLHSRSSSRNVHRYFLYLGLLLLCFWRTTSGRRCGFSTRPPDRIPSGWAWAR